MLSDVPIICFDASFQKARISYSPLMLKVYVHETGKRLSQAAEAAELMDNLFNGHGKDPVYLSLDLMLSHKSDLALILRRLQ